MLIDDYNYETDQEETFIVCNGRGCDNQEPFDMPRRDHEYHPWSRSDHYGIFTGHYCDECYENNYPYRKDNYFDPGYAGEYLEDDY